MRESCKLLEQQIVDCGEAALDQNTRGECSRTDSSSCHTLHNKLYETFSALPQCITVLVAAG